MTELHVVFRVADAEYILPASEVITMESWSGATKVPGAPHYVAGIVQIRGQVLPVLDLRARFGLPSVEPGLDTRVIVAQVGDRAVGLLVDRARRVLSLDADAFRPPPEVVADQAEGFVRSVAHADGHLVMRLDLGRLVGEGRADGG